MPVSECLNSEFNRPHNIFNNVFTGTTNPTNINNERLDTDRGLLKFTSNKWIK